MRSPVRASFDPNRPAAIAAAVALGTVGVLSFIVQPALVQGFVSALGMSEAAAVGLAGIEMAGVAIATVAAVPLGRLVDWRWLTALSIAVAVAGNLLSAAAAPGLPLSAARLVAGAGHGMIISLSFTFIGLTRRTDRNIALYLVSLLTYGAFGLWAAPTILRTVGIGGIFTAFAVVTAVSAATIPFVPRSSAMREEPSPLARQLRPAMLATALAGVLVYNVAQGIAWANLFLIGTAAGLPEQAVANALFVSQVLAVGGALLAVVLAHRASRVPPIVVGILGGAACIALLAGRPGAAAFLVAVGGFNLLWNFVLPFILSAVGDMDLHGRMMAPTIAMQMTGLGIGPILSSALIGEGSFGAVEAVCIGCFLASLALLALPLAAHHRAGAAPAWTGG